MNLIGPINSGVAVGGNGAALSNQSSNNAISGKVVGAYVRYNDAPPATTDVILKTVGTYMPSMTLLTLTNKNTDGLFLPRTIPTDNLGVALAALTVAEPFPVADYMNISIDGANAGDSVDVWLLVE